MTTLEQAARQALEALNGSQYRMRGYGYQAMETTIASNNEAIEALRQALEPKPCDMGEMCLDCQPRGANGECPDQQPCNPSCAPGYCYCKEMAEQPKQEPVAWLDEERNIIYRHNTHKTDDYHGFKRTTPLYTEPPKRECVGLTDEEIGLLTTGAGWSHLETPALLLFARAIEAKLKGKNT